MKKIRFIFFFVVSTLLSFSYIYNHESEEFLCPIEVLAEETETGISVLLKDQDDSACLKSNRRNSSNNSENFSNSKSEFKFTYNVVLDLEKKKTIYYTDFQLWNQDKIDYLHLFQLF